MNYLELNTFLESDNPQDVARETITTVGSLIDRLSMYDSNLKVVVSQGKKYGGIGGTTLHEEF